MSVLIFNILNGVNSIVHEWPILLIGLATSAPTSMPPPAMSRKKSETLQATHTKTMPKQAKPSVPPGPYSAGCRIGNWVEETLTEPRPIQKYTTSAPFGLDPNAKALYHVALNVALHTIFSQHPLLRHPLWFDLPSSSQQPIYQSISAAQFPRKEPEPPPRAPPRVQVLGGPPTDDKKGRPLSPGRIIPAPTKVDMSMYTVNTHDQYGGKFAGPGVNQVHSYPEETTDFTQLAPSGAGLTQDYLEVKAAVKAERAASPKQERPRSANRVVPFPMLENPFDKSIYQTNTHSRIYFPRFYLVTNRS